jgi:hypothetical protein
MTNEQYAQRVALDAAEEGRAQYGTELDRLMKKFNAAQVDGDDEPVNPGEAAQIRMLRLEALLEQILVDDDIAAEHVSAAMKRAMTSDDPATRYFAREHDLIDKD